MMHRQIVEQEPGTGLERHCVRQLEHSIRLQRNDFRHRPAQHRQSGDAITGRHVRAVRCAAHHARDLRSWGVRHLRLVLIKPPRLQGVGKRHTRGVYVDEDLAVAAGLVDLDDFRGLRAIEPGYLYRAHRTI
jgi:hypothetical protein